MKWITSDGGPLICIGQSTVNSWRGIDGLGQYGSKLGAYRNDYERACAIRDYVGIIPVSERFGIVLGDMPLETTVMMSPERSPLIVRAFYSEPNADIASMIASWRMEKRLKEVESVRVSNVEANWYMFDSAYPGYLGLEKCLTFTLPINTIIINTFEFKPDHNTFLLVHEFVAEHAQ